MLRRAASSIPGLLLLVALLAGARAARADGDSDAEAARLFKAAVAEFKAGEAERAARLFLRSYELSPRPATICNLALSYDKWPGHEAAAQEAYHKCAEDDESGRYRDHALERARTLREKLSHEAPPPASPPPATRTSMKAKPSASSEEGAFGDPGEPAPQAAPAPSPRQKEAEPPPERPRRSPTKAVAPRDEEPAPRTVARRAPAPEPAPPPPRSHGALVGGILVGILGAASFGVGVGFVTGTYGDAAVIRGANPTLASDHPLVQSVQQRLNIGTSLYVAGGVLSLAGVVLVIVDAASRPAAPPRTASAGIVPVDGGAMLFGRFSL